MATVATITRQIFLPNLNANGQALDNAVGQLLNAINQQPVTVGPFREVTSDNQYTILTVSWPSTSDTAFVSGGVMANVATALGLSVLATHQFTSTAAY